MEHFRYELHTGSEAEVIDLWLNGLRGRIEVAYVAMGTTERGYRLACAHQPLSPAFGILEVEQAETRTADGEFVAVELDEEQVPLPLVVEYLRVPLSPVFVHGGSSLAFAGTVTPEFTLMLAVYDTDGRPERGVLREIYDHLDKRKLAAQEAEPGAATDGGSV
ncbi:hypothetical protein [Tuwongella immobilis]|uniref:Uncharacterized protein n=1 Tax=Tuwongella immobilis TaxID=692036 RepID=A0A6C2YJM0_9BACT|nr:hypothetical protein [Tuwongella immobilis]VIP01770.1 unnamed protein product [Tuwongella immobilis]VTR99397.1 unnamed protein product [Tuwongella immobilis]